MSVIQSLKAAVGLTRELPTYRCTNCENTFESPADPDSHWLRCVECDSDDLERIESA